MRIKDLRRRRYYVQTFLTPYTEELLQYLGKVPRPVIGGFPYKFRRRSTGLLFHKGHTVRRSLREATPLEVLRMKATQP